MQVLVFQFMFLIHRMSQMVVGGGLWKLTLNTALKRLTLGVGEDIELGRSIL